MTNVSLFLTYVKLRPFRLICKLQIYTTGILRALLPDCITNHPPPVISISIGSTGETFCEKIRWSRYTVAVVSFVIGKDGSDGGRRETGFARTKPVRQRSCHRAVSGLRRGKQTRKKHIYTFTQDVDSKIKCVRATFTRVIT